MAKTYRALGIVAIVTLLVLIVQVIIIANSRIEGLPGPPPAFPLDSAFYTTFIWPLMARQFAPIIATFSVVVAGQTRRWGWLVVFIVTGLIGAFGAVLLFFSPVFIPVNFGIVGASPDTMRLITHLPFEVIPPAIPALAALVFAAINLRSRPSAQGAAPQSGQA